MKSSLKVNGILNVIRSLLKVVFPLVTYKYVSIILGVVNVGRYNFAASIVSYFSFIAALGIYAYSVRNGVVFRDDKDKLEKFVSEIFSINLVSTGIAYGLMALLVFSSQKIKSYSSLIFILGLQIIFTTIGIEWLYSVLEDYLYITVRTIAFQIVSLVLLFLLVKDKNDVNAYAAITVISSAGSNVLNFIHARKICKFTITRKLNLKKHIAPILIIFAQNISVLVFVSSDMTLIGLLSGDYYTGIYTIATNIYKGIKTVLSALIVVSIPRLSYYWGNGDNEKFLSTIRKLFSMIMTFVFPIIVGVVFLSREMILFLSNENYVAGITSLQLLGVATLFSVLSYIYGQCILIPVHKEVVLLKATILSALINICLNFIAIPLLQQDGAAITTIIAEAFVFAYCWADVHKEIKICDDSRTIVKPLLGSCVVAFSCIVFKTAFKNVTLILFAAIISSIVLYYFVEMILKNENIIEIQEKIIGKIKRRIKNECK